MKTSILISTTESIEGMKVEKYIDFISTNVVLGTNVFSDFGASFSDFFGGTSDIYQNKLDRIYKTAIDKLKQKAQALGANGIIGLRLDFDEISGKGKSMFMVSASGMGVRLTQLGQADKNSIGSGNTFISPEDLDIQISKIKIIKKVKQKEPPTIEELNFLLEFPIEEITEDLTLIYLSVFKDGPYVITDYQKSLREFFPVYLRNLDLEIVSTVLYPKIKLSPEIIPALIKESQSFNPDKTLELLENNDPHNAILSLESSKRTYQRPDLEKMKLILNKIDNLPNTGKIESVKSLLGGTKEKFICEKNHQNDIDKEFCSTDGCWRNIKGLSKSAVEKINDFRLRIEGLEILIDL